MNNVKIVRFDEVMEDEVTVSSECAEITCTSPHGVGGLEVGKEYPAEIQVHAFQFPSITELPVETEDKLTRVGSSYSYVIVGTLKDEYIESCGFRLEGALFADASSALNGKKVAIQADRLEVYF